MMHTVTTGDSYFPDLYHSIQEDIYTNVSPADNMQPDFMWSPVVGYLLNLKILGLLKKRGFVLVSVESKSDIYEIIRWQNRYLGPSMKDRGHDEGGYSTVMAEKNGKFFVNSSLTQPIHTDEGHTSVLPRYISLYCETPSVFGGVSTLVQSDELIEKLKTDFGDKINLLFKQNAVHVKNVGGSESKNILMWLEDGRIGISYSPILRGLTCERTVFDMYACITKYVHEPENQIRFRLAKNQLLIMDNCRVLHGRTKFSVSDERVLYRMWFSECRLDSIEDLTV